MTFATVLTALTQVDAQLARSRLDAAGFHPFILHEDSTLGLGWNAGGSIQLQVPEAEAEEARALLASYESPTEES